MIDPVSSLIGVLNLYANLLLVIITGVYALLTWCMVGEMRRARESQLEPSVVVGIVPWPPLYAKVLAMNAGTGVALDLEVTLDVSPPGLFEPRTSRHSMLPSRAELQYMLPDPAPNGKLASLNELSQKYDCLTVAVAWTSAFGRKQTGRYEFRLTEVADGWYKAGGLVPPPEAEESLKRLAEAMTGIRKEVAGVGRVYQRKQWSQSLSPDTSKSADEADVGADSATGN